MLSAEEKLSLVVKEMSELLHGQISNLGAVIGFLQFVSIEVRSLPNPVHAKGFILKATNAALEASERSKELKNLLVNLLDPTALKIKENS